MNVKVCIPHYFNNEHRETTHKNGYGSHRYSSKNWRSISLSRCITNLLNLQRGKQFCYLNHKEKRIDVYRSRYSDIKIDINIIVDGKNMLQEVLELYRRKINIITVDCESQIMLASLARDKLIQTEENYNLFTYMEDDIIIHDQLFFEKNFWFLEKTNHDFVLMPHRYERIDSKEFDVLLVDGDLDFDFIGLFQEPKENIGNGKFNGESVSFDLPHNPHSGTFTISKKQADILKLKDLPYHGFIGPLETAATLSVLKYFKVLKTNVINWKFLSVEHGHTSFVNYINTLPKSYLLES